MLEEVFDDFLRFAFPQADRIFNMYRGFEFLDKELGEMYPEPDKRSNTRFVDKLVKVYTKTGKARYLLVHVEVQGHHDPRFTKRMFKYFYRIFDRFDHPVIPIAIFTGRDGKRMPDRYEFSFGGMELMYKFNTLYIIDYDDEILKESHNRFALVLLAAKTALLTGVNLDGKLLSQKILIFRILYERGPFSKAKIAAIVSFLHNYVFFSEPKINRIFMQQVDLITGKKNTMGIIEQLAEIRAKEARADERENASRLFVRNLLKDSEFSLQKIASMANTSLGFVKKVKKELYPN